MGDINKVTNKKIFIPIKNDLIWLGYNNGHTLFDVPASYTIPDFYDKNDKSKLRSNGYVIDKKGKLWRNLGNICWFTNLEIPKRHEALILYKNYSPEEYPKYDNYDAIHVSRTDKIPCDYDGIMGVPISFLHKYCPEQFELIGYMASTKVDEYNCGYPYIAGKKVYARILIRRK